MVSLLASTRFDTRSLVRLQGRIAETREALIALELLLPGRICDAVDAPL